MMSPRFSKAWPRYRWAEGHNDRLPELAGDLVRRGVAVIVGAASTPASLAAKAATQTIPIVFFVGTDPVEVGLVTSLSHPGGNVTGVTTLNVELTAKSLELAHSLIPPEITIGVLINPNNVPVSTTERRIVQDMAQALDAHFLVVTARSTASSPTRFVQWLTLRKPVSLRAHDIASGRCIWGRQHYCAVAETLILGNPNNKTVKNISAN
jgi:putative tryptophan/tyrosine transport system substrate-binding protein